MVKKKKKKKIITRKKVAKIAKRAKKRVKEIPESVYGEKIEIQQQVQPIIETVIEEAESKEQNEIFEDTNEEPEIEVVEDQEIRVMNNEKDLDNKQKHILMYIAISCIMVAVIFFWLVGVKNSLGQNLEKTDSDQELSSFINEIGNSIKSMTNYIDNQKKQIADFTTKAKSVIIEEKLKQDISGKIKDQLENSSVNSIINQ